MDALIDFFKFLMLMLCIAALIAAAPFVVARIVDVYTSPEGLWPSPEAIGIDLYSYEN